MAYLCGYEYFKNRFTESSKDGTGPRIPEFAIHFAAGMLAETLACIIYVPVDVIKERLQVQRNIEATGEKQKHLYSGSYDALRKILKNEGLSGIYKGYYATLASFGPFSALYFVFYERMKDQSRGFLQQDTLPLHYTILCSATAGAGASWLTSPLDMAKLRLQIQRGKNANATAGLSSSAVNYRGMSDCLSHIYREGGLKGLFRGAGARVIHWTSAMTITMTCYEEFRSFYSNILNK